MQRTAKRIKRDLETRLVSGVGLIIATASATQDITVDALRIEQIDTNEGKSMAAGAAVAFGTVVSSMRTDQQQSQLLTQAAHSESATAPAAPAEPKPMACLHLSLGAVAKAEVLGRFPAVHSRVLAERVLLRPCLIEEKSEMRVRVLAYAQSNQ